MPNAAAPARRTGRRTAGPLACRDHHGRQRALGGGARPAAREGHRRGVEALRRVVRAAGELGILYLTIFSFSSENWSRPATEIGDLFGLLRRFIRNDLATLHRDGVRVRVIGERDGLEPDICALLNEAEELTRDNTAQSRGRVQLRLAAGNRPRGAAAGARGRGRQARSGDDRRRHARPISRCARYSRSRSDHPHQRRAAAVEFPDVAGGLQRTRVRADPLAGFRQGRARSAIAEYARRERRFGGLAAKTGS
jgi:undecaprenyl diphosphate synthase